MPRARILDLRWSALLNDFQRSGLTHAEFCHRRGISIHSFRKRLYHARTPKPAPTDERSSAGNTPHFLPVTILPDPTPAIGATQHALELIVPNGRRIAVAPGFDPQTLRRLLTVVEDGPCSD
ncbi:MAG: IS66 family insertion sequence element accessory protein TnpA [Isosphaeraceae bacterium]